MLGKNRLELHFSFIPPFVPSKPHRHHPSCFDRRWLWVHPQLGHSNVAYTIAHPLRVSKEPCGYLGVENLGGRSDNCVALSVVTLENDHFPEGVIIICALFCNLGPFIKGQTRSFVYRVFSSFSYNPFGILILFYNVKKLNVVKEIKTRITCKFRKPNMIKCFSCMVCQFIASQRSNV